MGADRRIGKGFSRLSRASAFQGESINRILCCFPLRHICSSSTYIAIITTSTLNQSLHSTTMPALKTKTNLPNASKDPSSIGDAPEKKKKPYARKTSVVDKDKDTTKKPKAKVQPKKVNAAPAMDPPRAITGSTRRVEVVIDRMTVEDEIASPLDGDEHLGEDQIAQPRHPRISNDVAPSRQSIESSVVGRKEELEFWKGDDEESIDGLFDDLLGKDQALKGAVGKGMKSGTDVKHQDQGGNAAARKRIAESDKKEQNSNDMIASDHPIHAQSSVSTINHAATSDRTPPKLSKVEEEDLIHSVVIKVLEHALSKNVDWYKMAADGFAGKKAVQPAKAKGKGKGKKADPSDEREGLEPRKVLGKVDGNYLCESSGLSFAPFRELTPLSISTDDLFHYVSPLASTPATESQHHDSIRTEG